MALSLTQFLDVCRAEQNFFRDAAVVSFQGQKEFPLLFFSIFFRRLKTTSSYSIETLDVAEHDLATIFSKLETSFLGMRTLYWLRSFSIADEKKRLKLMAYVESYQGPNCILFFVAPRAPLKIQGHCIEIPEAFNKKEFMHCFSFLEGEAAVKRSTQFITTLFSRNELIHLDQACIFMRYAVLLGAGQQEFVDSWLDVLLVPEKSLFSLSQFFFAKSPKKFFSYWSRIGGEYSEPFWITFWSEQLWRAHFYVDLMKQKKFAQAKGVAFRLPFSLIQTDWQKLRVDELKQAHDFLYSLDFSLKNGGNAAALDLLYSKFFLNQF